MKTPKELIKYYIEHNTTLASINKRECLFWAINNEHIETVKYLKNIIENEQ